MNESDVPQDEGALYQGQLRRVTWARTEDGAYKGVPSRGWEAEIDATAVSVAQNNTRIQQAHASVVDGAQSVLAYHMTVNLLDAPTLATEARTWTWRVRRHLRPGVWAGLGPAWKQRYASVLGLSVDALEILPEYPELYGCGPA